MKQFFKFMFASMLGVFLSLIILFFISLFILFGILSMAKDGAPSVDNNSILEITLDHPVKERTSKNPFEGMNFNSFKSEQDLGLNDILKNIDKAKNDSRIKGIFLNLSTFQGGISTAEEIRNALIDFKNTHKFIYAYSEYYSQGTYYLASVADRIFLNPQGELIFHGLNTELTFFKGALEKLEVEPEIIRHGKFKSAVEPFINDKMSPENRAQVKELQQSIWKKFIGDISTSRNITSEKLMGIANEMEVRNPEDALRLKMVDQLAYFDEVQSELRKISGLTEKNKLRLISMKKYDKVPGSSKAFSAKKIAIIYAVGDIMGGEGNDDVIGSGGLSETIRKARLDSSIKAIVLRVNSPGGSALASDVIWREVLLAKKAKPVVVSMGDLAASGGYYISCAADSIVAEPGTITGSIGVFGLLFNAQKMFNNKLGITFDTVKTGKFSGIGSMTRPMTAQEKEIIQLEVERIYDTFITHVAEGRKMNKADVDSIGQGRVWSGTDAKQLGLVDALGGINTALDIAARMAKLGQYRVISLPEQKDFLQKLLEDYSTDVSESVAKKQLGESYKYYNRIQSMLKMQGIQARLPFEIEMY
ncbi:MAG: signal peptide peptidase SppA [Bacteroidetes bacterium]|nr:signal peptide peptidase SppA [Bacteroidota bacterium]